MEKLIELLNEWSKTAIKNKCNWTDMYDEDGLYFMNLSDRDMTMEVEEVISKTFGFIKWLVENDKVNIDAYKTVYSGDLDKRKTLTMSSGGDEFYQVTEHGVYESLLMLLTIQDNPIDFLTSILK